MMASPAPNAQFGDLIWRILLTQGAPLVSDVSPAQAPVSTYKGALSKLEESNYSAVPSVADVSPAGNAVPLGSPMVPQSAPIASPSATPVPRTPTPTPTPTPAIDTGRPVPTPPPADISRPSWIDTFANNLFKTKDLREQAQYDSPLTHEDVVDNLIQAHERENSLAKTIANTFKDRLPTPSQRSGSHLVDALVDTAKGMTGNLSHTTNRPVTPETIKAAIKGAGAVAKAPMPITDAMDAARKQILSPEDVKQKVFGGLNTTPAPVGGLPEVPYEQPPYAGSPLDQYNQGATAPAPLPAEASPSGDSLPVPPPPSPEETQINDQISGYAKQLADITKMNMNLDPVHLENYYQRGSIDPKMFSLGSVGALPPEMILRLFEMANKIEDDKLARSIDLGTKLLNEQTHKGDKAKAEALQALQIQMGIDATARGIQDKDWERKRLERIDAERKRKEDEPKQQIVGNKLVTLSPSGTATASDISGLDPKQGPILNVPGLGLFKYDEKTNTTQQIPLPEKPVTEADIVRVTGLIKNFTLMGLQGDPTYQELTAKGDAAEIAKFRRGDFTGASKQLADLNKHYQEQGALRAIEAGADPRVVNAFLVRELGQESESTKRSAAPSGASADVEGRLKALETWKDPATVASEEAAVRAAMIAQGLSPEKAERNITVARQKRESNGK